MPLPMTHAFVAIAGAIAVARRPVPWRLIAAGGVAAMLPDLDALTHHFFGVARDSIYAHRGLAHSLFMAIVVGMIAAGFHEHLQVRRWVAGLAVGLATASHGVLDMMTDTGRAVAYWWPFTAARYFAIWRPIHIVIEDREELLNPDNLRFMTEIREVVVPMMLAAMVIRILFPPRAALDRQDDGAVKDFARR